MNDKMLNRLKATMAIQTVSYHVELMNKFILQEVAKIPGCHAKKHKDNIYVTRGKADLYPCIVAHTDTVHDIRREFHVLECDGKLLAVDGNMKRAGIGGDDKVGVFVALEMLRSTDVCKAAFFRDEEVGCRGSSEAYMPFFDNTSLVLQCDRQGYDDFVDNIYGTQLYEQAFSNAISGILMEYGRTESDGGMTDVQQLADNGLAVACANMSCGYYDPHTDNEYIVIDEVYQTLSMVQDIFKSCGSVKWEISQEERHRYSHHWWGGYGRHWEETDYSYRRFGGGKEKTKQLGNDLRRKDYAYYQDVFDNLDDTEVESSRGGEQPEKNKQCLDCEGHGTLHYDEYQHQYYCMGCQAYVSDQSIQFLLPPASKDIDTNTDDDFLQHLEKLEKEKKKNKVIH